jgi:hypothetical protein
MNGRLFKPEKKTSAEREYIKTKRTQKILIGAPVLFIKNMTLTKKILNYKSPKINTVYMLKL